MTITVLLAVRFVVLVVVRNEIVQREAIVRGNEIDARPRFAATAVKEIARCSEARSELGHFAFVALPVRANRVAVLVVPFGPTGRKLSDLIASGTNVPRLCDELYLRQNRILPAA